MYALICAGEKKEKAFFQRLTAARRAKAPNPSIISTDDLQTRWYARSPYEVSLSLSPLPDRLYNGATKFCCCSGLSIYSVVYKVRSSLAGGWQLHVHSMCGSGWDEDKMSIQLAIHNFFLFHPSNQTLLFTGRLASSHSWR